MNTDDSPNSPSVETEDYIKISAILLGIKLEPDVLPEVVENFDRIAAIAQPLLEFELTEDIESAATFEP